MNKRSILAVSAGLLTLAGCAHIASTNGTFTGNDGLVLTLTRHVDTIVRGPDIEEDQLLTLEVPRWELGKKLLIPSDAVRPAFSVSRFGPSSTGTRFKGYLIVKRVTPQEVLAHLHLVVQAQTADGSYRQKAKFSGNYVFARSDSHD